ncbi:hypothetical protein [Clostridium algidicarnis]|uniref:hypothetical protein n=1 Tax=Clostridium algidicarnis TaxID=37659 RepID=UPI001C0B84E2|nr:hypothetical protein [Clostridium algidicarnis]MBU3205160.1 hypothetical protein [Clostridium algidicarnis]MBU3213313.1 hypothetical protein [Clostridium algidicarnis]MBU3223792.1 hypothetical protein [Clostridium algidicarnis]
MNLLEQYIVEIHGVKEVTGSFKGEQFKFIEVDLTTNCYGCKQRTKTSFSNMEEWEKCKDQGYYLG